MAEEVACKAYAQSCLRKRKHDETIQSLEKKKAELGKELQKAKRERKLDEKPVPKNMTNKNFLEALNVSVTTVYARQEDLEEEWICEWFTEKLKCVEVDYADVILDSSEGVWKALTGTDCEWFDIEAQELSKVLEYVAGHNATGLDEYGVSLCSGPHSAKKRIFIDNLKGLSKDDCIALSERYEALYIMDHDQSIGTMLCRK